MKTSGARSKNGVASLAKPIPTAADRFGAGKARRAKVPRSSHAGWKAPARRPDPIAELEESNLGRMKDFIPIRYGRMLVSPFAFLRGSAAIMANDLSNTPVTGLRVQACGDAHLANFGAYATPERNFVFDVNDFDETLPAPWEWDIKRLCASVAVAGRHIGLRKKACANAVLRAVRSYRERIAEYAAMTHLPVWYVRLDVAAFVELIQSSQSDDFRATRKQIVHSHLGSHQLPKLTRVVNGMRRIIDNPPLVYHPAAHADQIVENARSSFEQYKRTLRDDVRVLFDRYQFIDSAVKVVGVGSVGTRCGIALFMASDDDALFLQLKEAMPSVLEPYAGKSRYENHGERVVTGQRLMQAASDMFLGWIRRDDGRDFYVRQLRDMKASADIEKMKASHLVEYALFCGWALARAHARAGDAAFISGYLGRKDTFDRALLEFAEDYADQTERDFDALAAAVKAGRLKAKTVA
jgi:uncharacterized protein (DUF2252 family)